MVTTLALNPYRKWVETYDSETFGEGAKWLIQLMDESQKENQKENLLN